MSEIQFDHAHARGLEGSEDLENFQALHVDCHAIKTHGTKATTAGSDVHLIAKGKRLQASQEEFRRAMLAKGEPKPKAKKPFGRRF